MRPYQLHWRKIRINLILNERDYAEQILFYNEFCGDPISDLGIAAKYFFAEGYPQKVVKRKICELLIRCDPTANIVKWDHILDRQVKRASKRRLVEIDYIAITKSEMDKIGALQNRTIKKMAFAYLCVAKYFNLVNEHNNGWTNLALKDICSMGGVALPVDKQFAMRGELARLGYLQLSIIVDNVNARVLFIDDASDEVLRITDMHDLGNQYFLYCGEPYIYCEVCGALVRKRSNRMRYCSDCAKKVDNEKRTGRYQKQQK